MEWLPIIATVCAVPQFLPQLLSVCRTGDTAGVSWAWASLTAVSNAGWIAYFTLSGLWLAVVPAASVTVLALALALLLTRHTRISPRAAAVTAGWAVLLALSWITAGRIGLGAVLAVAFALQVAPSVWSAFRTAQPTGVSLGTWLLILAELLCWGVYGLHKADPTLIALGWTGVTASTLIILRVQRVSRGGRRGGRCRATVPAPPRR